MKRREFFKRWIAKFLVALTLVGLIVYTVFHALGGSSGSLMTTPARRVTDRQILGGEAYLFRDEAVVKTDARGLVEETVKSGEKVGRDVCLANVWTGYSEEIRAELQRELDRLERLLAVLEEGQPDVGEPAINAQRYRQEASALFLEIRAAMEAGNEELVVELEDRMTVCLCRVAALTGNRAEVQKTLEELRARRDEILQGGYTSVYNTLSSGYFYNRSYVDGGEGLFTLEALAELSAESLDALREAYATHQASDFSVGKMVYGYEWYLAIPYASAIEGLMQAGEQYEVTFPENEDMVLTLICERIQVDSAGDSVVILRSTESPKAFEYLRTQHVEIEVGSCRGYYIPEQALTVQGGVDGVFIFENSTVYFRRIEILYRGDGYCIVAEQGDRGKDYLALNDIIVTAGKNLYDGRVYQ